MDCTVADLRDKLATANATAAEPDTLSLAPGCSYTFGATDTIDDFWFGPEAMVVSSDVTIEGNGATIARDPGAAPFRPGAAPFRLFFIGADATSPRTLGYTTPGAGELTLRNLTLSGGLAQGGASAAGGGGAGLGGAIFNQGSVTLDTVTVTGNSAVGGASTGSTGEQGGGGVGQDAPPGASGGGFGGATVPAGAIGGAAFGANGGGGGGFATGDDGDDATATDPGAGGRDPSGLGGFGRSDAGTDVPGGNGSGGGGVAAPIAGPGGGFGAGGGDGGGGGVGGGGGLQAGGGFGGGGGAGGGDGGFGGGGGAGGGDGGFAWGNGDDAGAGGATNGGGGGGLGGAIFNMQGSLSIVNATFTGNTATGGASGDGTAGLGRGGAIFNLNGWVTLSFSTIAANDAANGGRAVYDLAYDQATPRSADVALAGAILSSPTLVTADLRVDKPATVAGGGVNQGTATATLSGGNIVRSSFAIGGQIVGPIMTTDPQLGPLAANGGAVSTMLLADGSPAIDAGGTTCPATDARGVARPQGAACDLDAVELVRPPVDDAPTTSPPPPPPSVPPPNATKTMQKAVPRALGLTVNPRRDRKLPLRFAIRGRLGVPAGVALAQACNGRVTVKLRRRARTVAVRRPRLRLRAGRCSYSTTVVLRSRKRIGRRAKRLVVTARFAGNASLRPRSAKRTTVRVR